MLKYAPYSFSKINVYNHCPKKFDFQYIRKIGKFISAKALDRGKLIHSFLEHQGNIEDVKASSDYSQVIQSGMLSQDERKDAYKSYKTFTNSDVFKWIDSKTAIFREYPIGMDKHLNIKGYSDMDVIFRGYIDHVCVDEETNTLMIIDWKTGKYKEQEDQSWEQLLYYGISLFSKMPFDNILMMYAYVDHGKVNKKILKRENIKKYQKALLTNIKNIETASKFDKNEDYLCNWCEFMSVCQAEK